jgi:site-specific DNA-methyltransferase (adenine-specific)
MCTYSSSSGIVHDPFGGSGTTLSVGKELNRRFLGFELSPDYAAAIQARLDSVKPGQSLDGGAEPLAGGKGRGSKTTKSR